MCCYTRDFVIVLLVAYVYRLPSGNQRLFLYPRCLQAGRFTARRSGPMLLIGLNPINEARTPARSEEHTSELQSPCNLVCRLLLEKKKKRRKQNGASQKRLSHLYNRSES